MVLGSRLRTFLPRRGGRYKAKLILRVELPVTEATGSADEALSAEYLRFASGAFVDVSTVRVLSLLGRQCMALVAAKPLRQRPEGLGVIHMHNMSYLMTQGVDGLLPAMLLIRGPRQDDHIAPAGWGASLWNTAVVTPVLLARRETNFVQVERAVEERGVEAVKLFPEFQKHIGSRRNVGSGTFHASHYSSA